MPTVVIVVIAVGTASPLTGIALLVYFLMNPEKLDQWGSIIWRFLSCVGRYVVVLRDTVERGRTATDIQAVINTAGRELTAEAPGMLPHMMKIEWVAPLQAETYLNKGEVIVRLDRHANQERNIVVATLAYLSRGLLPRARIYVDHILAQATDFSIAKRIFARDRGSGSLSYFVTEILDPTVQQDPSLRQDLELLEEIEGIGFLTRVFLNELRELGERLQPALPTDRIFGEVRNFARFLHTIAIRQKGEIVPLTFEGARMKVTVVLVARPEVLEEHGLGRHRLAIETIVRQGFDVIYVSGWGDVNVTSVVHLLRLVEEAGLLTVLRTYRYPVPRYLGASNKGILAVCSSNVRYLERRREIARPVIDALAGHVDEIAQGAWEIAGVERKPGLGCKVAIRVGNGSDAEPAVRALMVRLPNLIHQLREELQGESIFLVPWSPNVKRFISSALALEPNDIMQLELDEEDLVARATVTSQRVAARAVGKGGWNVQTASSLVGWDIRVEVAPPTQAMPAQDRLVWHALHEVVPELGQGVIGIDGIAREPGVGSKILLRAISTHRPPSQICMGTGQERLRCLGEKLRGEWIGFVDYSDDPPELILRALYPLRKDEVVKLNLNEAAFEAEVIVKDRSAAQRAIGSHGANVRLAQELTNWIIKVRSEAELTKPKTELAGEELARDVLGQHIPEIRSGSVEVVRMIYEAGVGAKIAVRHRGSAVGQPDLMTICTGLKPQLDRVRAIRSELDVPFVTFVEWSEDVGKNTIRALYPLPEQSVQNVELDEGMGYVRLWIRSREAMAYAIGTRAQNLHLAERLLGLTIYVEEYSDMEPPSPRGGAPWSLTR